MGNRRRSDSSRREFLKRAGKMGAGLYVGATGFSLLLAACSKSPATPATGSSSAGGTVTTPSNPSFGSTPPKEVIFAAVQALTGPNSAWGQTSWNGIQMAAELINAQGGIKSLGGARIKAVIYDTESKPELAQAQTEKAIQDGAVIITGCTQSAASMLATTVCERLQVPFIAQDDNQQLIERGYKYTFKVRAHISEYTNRILDFARDMEKATGRAARKVAFLSENNGIGKNALEYGAELVRSSPDFELVDATLYDPATTDFTGFISKYKEAGVELVMGHQSTNPAIQITRTMKQLGFKPVAFGGLGGAQLGAAYVEALGADATDVLSTMAWAPSLKIPGMDKLKELYQQTYNKPMDDTGAAGVSMTGIVWDVMERAASYDPKVVRDAVAATDFQTPDRNFLFINGVKFREDGQNVACTAVLAQIRGTEWIPIAPKEFTDATAVWPMWA